MKRLLLTVLSVLLAFSLLPTAVFATDYSKFDDPGSADSSNAATPGDLPGSTDGGNTADGTGSLPDGATAPDTSTAPGGQAAPDASTAADDQAEDPAEADGAAELADPDGQGDGQDGTEFEALGWTWEYPFIIRPMFSDTRVIDIDGASSRSGAKAIIWPSSVQSNQRFIFEEDSLKPGYFTIKAEHSGKVLDISGGVARPGAEVVQWEQKPAGGNLNQLWRPISNGSILAGTDSMSFVSALDEDYAIDVSGGKDLNAASIVIWPYTANQINQCFDMIPVYDIPWINDYVLPDGIYSLDLAASPGISLDVSGASTVQGEKVIGWSSSGQLNQLFQITRTPEGFYKIISVNSGMSLDVERDNRVPSTPVLQWPYGGANNQLWVISDAGGGNIMLKAKSSGLAVTVGGANQAAVLRKLTSPTSQSQVFTPRPADTSGLPSSLAGSLVTITPSAAPAMRVDIDGGSYASGARSILWTDHGGNNQKFEVLPVGSGSPQEYALRSAQSGRYLEDAGSLVVQADIGPSLPTKPSQLWTAELSVGGYLITNQASGKRLCIQSGRAGSQLATTANAQDANQLFRLAATSITYSGHYRLNTPAGNRLDFSNEGRLPGSAVYLWSKHDNYNQKFLIQTFGAVHVLKSPRYPTALDIEGSSAAEGTKALVWNTTANANQCFYVVPSGDGWYYLKSAIGSYISAASDTVGAVVKTTNSASSAQRFRFEATRYAPYVGDFIDVNITTQRLMLVRDGFPVLECAVTTGMRGWDTPAGTHRINSMQRNTRLVGPGWNVPVEYWMAFTNMGHGFHDAPWRDSFGGPDYSWGGSHGCVNMPRWAADELYSQCYLGLEVRVHY